MNIDTAIAAAVIAGIVSILTTLLPKLISRRSDIAKAQADEGDAATKLSEAAAKQVQIYSEEIIDPLRQRIGELEKDNTILRSRVLLLETDNRELVGTRRIYEMQITTLQEQVKTLNRSLDTQRDQIVILIEQAASKDKTIKRMQEEIEQLYVENEALRAEILSLRLENNKLRGIEETADE